MMGFSLFTTALRPAPGPTRISYLGVQWLWSEAGHLPASSAEVKNAWNYNSTPQYVFTAWYLVKHRDDFMLPLPSIGPTCPQLYVVSQKWYIVQ